MGITPRDIEIVQAVYQNRALTTPQVTALVFGKNDRSTQCEERLKRLYHNGILERRSLGVTYRDNQPLVYLLAEKGAQLLCEADGISREEINWSARLNRISNHHLQHVVQVSEVRISIERATARLGYNLAWLDEMTIRRHQLFDTFRYHTPTGWEKRAQLIPDAFCTIDSPTMWMACFIEVDRGTETLGTVANKFAKYVAYLETDAYLNRYAAFNEEGHEIYPSILTITSSHRRMENMMQVARDVGAEDLYLFSTFPEVTYDRILEDQVWRRGGVHAPVRLMGDA